MNIHGASTSAKRSQSPPELQPTFKRARPISPLRNKGQSSPLLDILPSPSKPMIKDSDGNEIDLNSLPIIAHSDNNDIDSPPIIAPHEGTSGQRKDIIQFFLRESSLHSFEWSSTPKKRAKNKWTPKNYLSIKEWTENHGGISSNVLSSPGVSTYAMAIRLYVAYNIRQNEPHKTIERLSMEDIKGISYTKELHDKINEMIHIIKKHYLKKEFYSPPDDIVQSLPLFISNVIAITSQEADLQRNEKHKNTLLNKKFSQTTQKKEKEPSK